jgi:hypothetical protein
VGQRAAGGLSPRHDLGRHYQAYGFNAALLENYWNVRSPKAQERYFDNLVVSTEQIGC